VEPVVVVVDDLGGGRSRDEEPLVARPKAMPRLVRAALLLSSAYVALSAACLLLGSCAKEVTPALSWALLSAGLLGLALTASTELESAWPALWAWTDAALGLGLAFVWTLGRSEPYVLLLLLASASLGACQKTEARPTVALLAAAAALAMGAAGLAPLMMAFVFAYASVKPASKTFSPAHVLSLAGIGLLESALGPAGFVALVALQLLLVPIELELRPEFLIGSGLAADASPLLALPSHSSAAVTGSAAVALSASAGLWPGVVLGYLLLCGVPPAGVGLVAAGALTAEFFGPFAAQALHRATGSLLLTNLVAFWMLALSTPPALAALIVSDDDVSWTKAALVSVSCVWFRGCASALDACEQELLSERVVAESQSGAERERRGLILATLAVSSLLGAGVLRALPNTRGFEALALSATVVTFLCAGLFSVWFANNHALGRFRVVDGSGRELIRVSG
jgi:hypothetical protein